jgi:hypothetical protein
MFGFKRKKKVRRVPERVIASHRIGVSVREKESRESVAHYEQWVTAHNGMDKDVLEIEGPNGERLIVNLLIDPGMLL